VYTDFRRRSRPIPRMLDEFEGSYASLPSRCLFRIRPDAHNANGRAAGQACLVKPPAWPLQCSCRRSDGSVRVNRGAPSASEARRTADIARQPSGRRARAWLQRQARTTASGHTASAPARTRSARPTCRPRRSAPCRTTPAGQAAPRPAEETRPHHGTPRTTTTLGEHPASHPVVNEAATLVRGYRIQR
jgi:hypothetical protein